MQAQTARAPTVPRHFEWMKQAGIDGILPDLAETSRCGIEYLPVVYPGFSRHNLNHGPPNQIPRRGGKFYWRQVFNAISAGAVRLKTAMFDEVDEGTAIFKTSPTARSAPRGAPTLTLDADAVALPGDWYLRRDGPISSNLPLQP